MNYDTHDESGESSPTVEECSGGAPRTMDALPEAERAWHDAHFASRPPTRAEMERMYLEHLDDSRRAEAALALACVRTGEPQQASAPVYSIQMAVLESGKFRASVYRGKLRLWRATFGGEGEAWEQARGLVGELLEDEGPATAA